MSGSPDGRCGESRAQDGPGGCSPSGRVVAPPPGTTLISRSPSGAVPLSVSGPGWGRGRTRGGRVVDGAAVLARPRCGRVAGRL